MRNWPNSDFLGYFPQHVSEVFAKSGRTGLEWVGPEKKSPGTGRDAGLKKGPDEQGSADFGYSIVPEHQGKGYATEIARAIVEWALRRKDFPG